MILRIPVYWFFYYPSPSCSAVPPSPRSRRPTQSFSAFLRVVYPSILCIISWKTLELVVRILSLCRGTKKRLITVSSYISGFITELIGRIIIENKLYQGVASSTSRECKTQITMKGIQQRKSVVIMMVIFKFIFLFRSEIC